LLGRRDLSSDTQESYECRAEVWRRLYALLCT
jgi:hypothetical protein